MINSQKIDVVMTWPRPKTQTKVHSFLWLADYTKIFMEVSFALLESFIKIIQNTAKFK